MQSFRRMYTNDNIRREIYENMAGIPIIVILFIISVVLTLSGAARLYKDQTEHQSIPFDYLHSSGEIYYTEITGTPEKMGTWYYMVDADGHKIVVNMIHGDVYGKVKRDLESSGSSTVHGVIKELGKDEIALRNAIKKAYLENGYYDEDKIEVFGYFYLYCLDDNQFIEALRSIPKGLYYGLIGLFVVFCMIAYNGTFNLFKHKNPACGAVKYTREEIDEQVNSSEAIWLPYLNIYLAPKILVGIAKGVTAVEYEDIARIGIRDYRVVITTKSGRKLKVSAQRPTLSDDHKTLYEFCVNRNPETVIDEGKLYIPSDS